MQYHDFNGIKISALGLSFRGLQAEGEADKQTLFASLIKEAVNRGINYFDTSERYGMRPAGPFVGTILAQYPRDSFYLATGFCGYKKETFGQAEKVFQSQLTDLQTDHIDFYLLQNISEFNIDSYLDPANGLPEQFLRLKEAGKIRYLGCEFIGNIDPMKRFLDRYGEQIDFCRFPLNWVDWELHAAKLKAKLCEKWKLPVWAEDPLKKSLFEKWPAEMSLDRAYRFLQSIPGVKGALLEADDLAQLIASADAFTEELPLTKEEIEELVVLARSMYPKKMLSCTGCRKCMKHCIKFLDIAGFMELYNEETLCGPQPETPMYVKAYPVEKQPQSCCHWGPCQSVCPQKLDIIRMMLALATKVRRSPFAPL